MRTVVEPLEGNKVKLSVEVEEVEMDKAVDAALRRIARDVRIPGFRPGKAPRRILEARMGLEAVRQEALREALPDFYAQAIRESEVDPIAPPEIDITGGQETGPVAFDAVVEVRPQIQVPGYQGLQVTVANPAVSDDEIDKQIDRMRAQFGELNVVERPAQDGDFVTIDLQGSRDGEAVAGMSAEDYLYELGTGSVIEGLDDAVRGASAGDTREFTTALTEDDEVAIAVTVKEVKERVLPELTDEWASEASEFETVEDLRNDLRTRLGTMKKVQAAMAIRDEALRALVELVQDDVPEALVNQETQRRLEDLVHRLQHQGATLQQYMEATGQDEQALLDEARAAAVDAVKADLALRAVAEAEDLDATEDDIAAEVARLAEQTGQKPDQIVRQLERADQMPAVRSDIRKAKALGWLVEHVSVVDEEGNPIDRADLDPTPPASEDGEADADATAEETAE